VSLKRLRILLNLAANSFILLGHLAILESHLLEDLSHFSQRVNISNVVFASIKEFASGLLNLDSLLLTVVTVCDAATVCKSVVHG